MDTSIKLKDDNILEANVLEDQDGEYNLFIVLKTPNETFITQDELKKCLDLCGK